MTTERRSRAGPLSASGVGVSLPGHLMPGETGAVARHRNFAAEQSPRGLNPDGRLLNVHRSRPKPAWKERKLWQIKGSKIVLYFPVKVFS